MVISCLTLHILPQVLQLKEQLFDAEREIQRLAERVEGGSGNSPVSSSVSVEHNETSFFGDYKVEEDGDYDSVCLVFLSL